MKNKGIIKKTISGRTGNEQQNIGKTMRQLLRENAEKGDYKAMAQNASKYLTIDSEGAIKFLEKSILNEYRGKEVPTEFHWLYLKIARHYRKNNEFSKAEEIVYSIEDSEELSVKNKIEYELNLIRLAEEAQNENFDSATIETLVDTISDQNNNNRTPQDLEEIIKSCFGTEYSLENLIASDLVHNNGNSRVTSPRDNLNTDSVETIDPIPTDRSYSDELTIERRIDEFKKIFNLDSKIQFAEKGLFKGHILLKDIDTGAFIIEPLFHISRDGTMSESYGNATYIIPLEDVIPFIKMKSKTEVKETDERIKPIRHKGNYYERVRETKEKLMGINKNIEDSENVEQIESIEENTEIEPKTKSRYIVNDSSDKPVKNMRENKEFLNEINEMLGEVITPEIMEGLLKRVSYSFKNLYDTKLKDKLYERLNTSGISNEEIEKEARKAFLYIRMFKNPSMINSGAINGENLNNLIEESVLEYSDAFESLEQHKDESMTYNEMKKMIKDYVERIKQETIPQVEKEEITQNTEEIIDEKEEQENEDVLEKSPLEYMSLEELQRLSEENNRTITNNDEEIKRRKEEAERTKLLEKIRGQQEKIRKQEKILSDLKAKTNNI